MLSTTALLLEELSFHTYPKARHLLVLFLVSILENFGYRQVMSVWRLQALWGWIPAPHPLGRHEAQGRLATVESKGDAHL